MEKWFEGEWGLILGSSSGFGLATARELASKGMNIVGVHFDRKKAMAQIEEEVKSMRDHYGVDVVYYNYNAADEEKCKNNVKEIKERMGSIKPLRTIMHSLAFGSLHDYFSDEERAHVITRSQLDMTVHIMSNSLVYWIQELYKSGLVGQGTRIFAMTSSGSNRPWPHYGAISAAKASLESHIRQIALELGAKGVRANSICAGVTDTPALRKIPGHEALVERAQKMNPSKRLTQPEDVGKVISLLSREEAYWINGDVIRVDGGEEIAG